jgi:hypothetical protein
MRFIVKLHELLNNGSSIPEEVSYLSAPAISHAKPNGLRGAAPQNTSFLKIGVFGSESAANARQGKNTLFRKPRKILHHFSCVIPLASSSSTSYTVMRIPRMHGFSPRFPGSIVMISSYFIAALQVNSPRMAITEKYIQIY